MRLAGGPVATQGIKKSACLGASRRRASRRRASTQTGAHVPAADMPLTTLTRQPPTPQHRGHRRCQPARYGMTKQALTMALLARSELNIHLTREAHPASPPQHLNNIKTSAIHVHHSTRIPAATWGHAPGPGLCVRLLKLARCRHTQRTRPVPSCRRVPAPPPTHLPRAPRGPPPRRTAHPPRQAAQAG